MIENPDATETERPIGGREAKKRATREALLTSAHRRFRDDGFERTTLDDICDDVGVSRRTFFRYFKTKEDLVFPNRADRLERFLSFLGAGPPVADPFDMLRRATRLFGPEYMANKAQLIAQQQLINSSPTLRAREMQIDRDWELAMGKAMMAKSPPGPASELRARVLAGACIGVIRATMRHWFDSGGVEDLTQLGESALDCLERGFSLTSAD